LETSDIKRHRGHREHSRRGLAAPVRGERDERGAHVALLSAAHGEEGLGRVVFVGSDSAVNIPKEMLD
jgi:hypothetical protein